jgi:conjugal transfer ATP-binding protein TraC
MWTSLAWALRLVHSEERAARPDDIEALAIRDRFSDFLPYDAYDAETQEFFNADQTIGRIWECSPLTFLGEKGSADLASMLRQDYPADTVIQFLLYPDDDIDPVLQRYLAMKTRSAAASQEAARRYAEHMRSGRQGLGQFQGIPVRHFRLFVAIKSRAQLPADRIAMFAESLRQAGLAPRPLVAEELLHWLRRLFGTRPGENLRAYDPNRYLRKQVIQANTVIEETRTGLRIGTRWAACLTPKSMPSSERVDALGINRLIGGIRGPEEDATQLTHQFLWTTSVFFAATSASIRRKAGMMMAQRAGGTIAKTIKTRVDELSWVLDDLNKDRYVDVITSLWIFGENEEDLNQGVARAWALWDAQKFLMQQESRIAKAMFIAALPFGLYNEGRNITTLDRNFEMSAQAAALMLPVQADFAGRMDPVLMYVGRKGQLATIDVFDPGANNHNYLVCAGSGAGKSFQTNFLVSNYYGSGSKIRLVDIGYSYQKQCMIAGGRYIDIGDEARLCLNPFHSIGRGEDARHDELTTAQVVLTMVYSATGTAALSETQYSLAKDAVRFAYSRDAGLYGIDHVEEYLRTYPALAGKWAFEGAKEIAHEMAFNIRDFTSEGTYGRLFNGPSTLDLSSDDFVVLEMERLLVDAELFRVVAMQVINAVTQDLYLSDRTSRRFIVFEEVWKYFSSAPMIAMIIEEAYRRARKYGGSTGVITQSPLDLLAFGPAGAVIKANSAFKFFLESSDYQEAVNKGVLEYSGLLLDLAKSVRNNRPRYSEVLFDTPFGAGVGRLCVDPWTYWNNTSTASEFARFKTLLVRGLSPKAAIDQLAGSS